MFIKDSALGFSEKETSEYFTWREVLRDTVYSGGERREIQMEGVEDHRGRRQEEVACLIWYSR